MCVCPYTNIGFSKLVSKSVSLLRSGTVLSSMTKKEGSLLHSSDNGEGPWGSSKEDMDSASQWGSGIMAALVRKNTVAVQDDDLARMDSMV